MDNADRKRLIGIIIKKEREKRKLTQDALSEKIEVDAGNLSNIENGKSFPSISTLCKIMQYLSIEPNRIFSFISLNSIEVNTLDLFIQENVKSLPDEIKISLSEVIKFMNK